MGKILTAITDAIQVELQNQFKPSVIAGLEALRAESRKLTYEMTGEQMYRVYWDARTAHLKGTGK